MPNLTQAWTRAEASKPHGWTLRGVVLGPREVDPVIRSETWVRGLEVRTVSESRVRARVPR